MLNAAQRHEAEQTVQAAATSGHWAYAPLALIADRLDALVEMFEESGRFAEADESNRNDSGGSSK